MRADNTDHSAGPRFEALQRILVTQFLDVTGIGLVETLGVLKSSGLATVIPITSLRTQPCCPMRLAADERINLVLRYARRAEAKPGFLRYSHSVIDEWGLNVIRTIWLGLTFAVILACAGSFRFAFGHFDVGNASGFVRREAERTIEAKAIPLIRTKDDALSTGAATLTNSPRLPIDSLAANTVSALFIASPHSQELILPALKKRSAGSKQKVFRGRVEMVATADSKDCQLLEFDAIRRMLNLPTGCHT